ncbi:MAG: choice-of-anchor L domain-containing protein [Bacteroidota bacterium]
MILRLRQSLVRPFVAIGVVLVSSLVGSADLKGQIDVVYNLPANVLSEAIAGDGVQILNAELNCPDSASGGYIISGIPDFPEGRGVILTTGNAANIFGPNDTEAKTTINNAPGDPLVTQITGNSSFDACILEFDVVPVGDSLEFNFTFASEEYDEYVGTPFNDFFGFFISGPGIAGDPGLDGLENIAVLPGTSTPVGINTVHNGNPDLGVPPLNPEFYVGNPLGLTSPIQYDAWTTGLSAVKQVTPCDTFSIKLVIADVADPEWDSAVLIEEIRSSNVSLSQTNEGDLASTIEGCNNGTVTFTRTPVINQDAVITFFVDGTATNGVDYNQIGDDPDPSVPKTITIPAGQASISIDIIPIDDGIIEGEEFIDIFVGNPNCSGTVQDSIRVFINDSINVSIDPPLAFVCLGDSLTFDVTADDNASFSWSPTDYLNDSNIKEPTTTPLLDINYLLTVTAAACQSTAISEIRVSDVQLDFDQVDVACAGDNTGSIDMTITGGESPYEIVWSGPNGFTSMDEDISNLEAGLYVVLVTDRDGCSQSGSIEILEVPEIVLELTSPTFQGGFNVSCFESDDGSATVIPSGGTEPFEYLWNDPGAQTTQTATNLEAGTYEVLVTDDNGCTETGTITLSAPEPVTASIDNITDVLCNGEATGEVTILPTGGVGPYTVVWNTVPPQFGVTATGLEAGFYTASITDVNGCQGTTEVEILEPTDPLTGTITTTNVICNGELNGTASADIDGGTPPYSYDWSPAPGQDQSSITGIPAGSYGLIVTDDNGCVINLPFTITEPDELVINTLSELDPACNGFDDGVLEVLADGGTGPYDYSWNTTPVQTTPQIENLGPGSYTVTVTDANGCTAEETYSLTEPVLLEVGLIQLEQPTCDGFSDGSIEIEATGGTAPFDISWNTIPPSNTALIENLPEGSYTVTITDANDCEATQTFDLIAPEPLSAQITNIENVLCNGDATGTVTIDVSGGTPNYTITWNDPLSQTGTTASNLAAGVYTATIVDDNGCTLDFEVEITEPTDPLAASITAQTDVLCFGDGSGSATVTATGGSGSYSYLWDDPLGQQTATASGLAAGSYTVTVSDNNGCATPVVVPVTIGGPIAELELTLTPSIFGGGFNVACAEDSTATIDLGISGGTPPYDILWNLPGLDTSTDEDLSNLAPGEYSVTVTDDNGCAAEANITLTAPPALSIEATTTPSDCFGIPTGELSITISGGVPGYTANWTGPNGFTGTGTSFTNLEGGVYIVTVEDDNGCTLVDAVTVVQPEDIVITIDSLSDFNGFNLSCYNSSDGEIYTTPSGGTPPYDYQWNAPNDPNFSNLEDVTDLSAGTFEVVVIDDNGCVQNEIVELVAPDTVDVDFTVSEYLNGFNISCFGEADGSIEATPVAGVAPLSYIWIGSNGFGPSTDNPIENLEAGEYSVFIEDADGCTAVETITIIEPEELDVLVIPENNISCAGGSDGSINLIFEGGTPPITISWTGPDGFTSTDEDLFDLAAGEYCVTLTDDNNCVTLECVTLTEPDAILITLDPFVYPNGFNLSCDGASDGSIDAIVSGGTGAYTYQWSGPNGFNSIDEDITLLEAGEYCLTVTDENGCSETACITLTAPVGIEIIADAITNISCFGFDDGAINITITSGTPPFIIGWTGPNGFTSTDEDIANLEEGTYCITITDNDGCLGENCFDIATPEELIATFVTSSFEGGFEIACSGDDNGFINTSVSGGTEPYNFDWTGPDGFTSSIANIENLAPGTYCLEITDDNSCTFNQCIDIEEPTPLEIDPIIVLPTCGDGTLANVNLQISGGVPPYDINWSNGDDTEIVDLGEGDFDVIITDANNCQISETISIDLPEPIQIGFEVPVFPGGVNVACNGGATGSIDITPINAVGILTFSWTGPNGFTSSDEDLTNLEAGEYCVTITDELGCMGTDCITLTQPDPITANFSATLTSCVGSEDASAEIVVNGGVPVYSVSWTGPDGFSAVGFIITNLGLGTYIAEVTDANNCTESFSVEIQEPDPIIITLTSPEVGGINIECFGDNTGSINTTVIGGTPGYQYSWTGPDGYTSDQENPQDLFAGEYCLTITDDNGCEETDCITLTEAPGIDYTFDIFEFPNGFNVSCADNCDGSIDLTTIGGTGTIQYSWTGPPGFSADTEDIVDLCVGTYEVTTTDDNGCMQSSAVTLTSPEAIEIELESPLFEGGVEVSCFGDSTGAINTTVTGGQDGLTFSWNGPSDFTSEDEDLTDLIAGTYDLLVTDGTGCSQTASIALSEPSEALNAITASFEYPSGDNISCTGFEDGSITTTVTGGTPPYEFNWNGPNDFVSSDQNIDNLMAGEYTLVVLDLNSCVQTINVTLTEPDEPLSAEVNVLSEVLCSGFETGSLEVVSNGGSGNYEIDWLGPNDFTSSDFLILNLAAGIYTYAVNDENGCSAAGTETLVNPLELLVEENLVSPICEATDGSILIAVSGGTEPYDFEWDTGEDSQNLVAIGAGEYSLIVTDENDCFVSEIYVLEAVNPLSLELDSLQEPLCFGDLNGFIALSDSGGTEPIEYLWLLPNDSSSTETTIVGLGDGEYSVTVTDALGCSQSEIFDLEQPDELIIEGLTAAIVDPINGYNVTPFGGQNGLILDPIANGDINGGTLPYSLFYVGPDGYTSQEFGSIDSLFAGQYFLTVTDANGCQATDSIELIQPETLNLPNGISPNGDGFNDGLEIRGIDEFPQNKLVVFNRWGNVVYEENNYSNGTQWTGQNESGEELPEGTYFVVVEVNGEDNLRGYLELRR